MIRNLNQNPGSTPLDHDELSQLIPNLSTKEELNEWERQNILAGKDWAMNPRVMKREDPLIEPYLRELHKRMFDQTWKWAGKYRKTEKNLGVPFHQIMNGIAALLGDVHYWIDRRTFDLDEIAIRFHHRLVWIHPFPNGNGRHARLLADVIAVKNGGEEFTWGSIRLKNVESARREYIRCLRVADANSDDIRGLVSFGRG